MRTDRHDRHVIPVADFREHVAEPTCWCVPLRDTLDPGLYIHNALDERDRYEHVNTEALRRADH
jgi:hypothetical protein